MKYLTGGFFFFSLSLSLSLVRSSLQQRTPVRIAITKIVIVIVDVHLFRLLAN